MDREKAVTTLAEMVDAFSDELRSRVESHGGDPTYAAATAKLDGDFATACLAVVEMYAAQDLGGYESAERDLTAAWLALRLSRGH